MCECDSSSSLASNCCNEVISFNKEFPKNLLQNSSATTMSFQYRSQGSHKGQGSHGGPQRLRELRGATGARGITGATGANRVMGAMGGDQQSHGGHGG